MSRRILRPLKDARRLHGALGARLLAGVLGACALAAAAPNQAAAAVCADHPNQQSAQQAKDTRDADGDGVYCEALPCPCSKPGQTSPKPTGPTREPASETKPNTKTKPKPRAKRKPPTVYRGTSVVRAIDGDTVLVMLPGREGETPVRLLGIDAPDMAVTRNGTEECGGQQASDALQALSDKWDQVTLRLDTRVGRFDQYGRLQAYIVPAREPDSTYQQQLLQQGLARPYKYWRKAKLEKRFAAAAGEAQASARGIWALCAGDVHAPILPSPADITGPAGDKTIVVASEGFHRAGSWDPSRDGDTLADLIGRWGQPDSYVDCVADWADLGVSAATTYFPGKCRRSSSAGAIKYISATGAGWRTNRGLAIGDDIDRMDALYPNPPEEPFWDDDIGAAYAPLSGYFLGSLNGPLKADLVATVDADTELVTELGSIRIYGAG